MLTLALLPPTKFHSYLPKPSDPTFCLEPSLTTQAPGEAFRALMPALFLVPFHLKPQAPPLHPGVCTELCICPYHPWTLSGGLILNLWLRQAQRVKGTCLGSQSHGVAEPRSTPCFSHPPGSLPKPQEVSGGGLYPSPIDSTKPQPSANAERPQGGARKAV